MISPGVVTVHPFVAWLRVAQGPQDATLKG